MSNNIPQHIGIIPDGNRRWAKAQGVPTLKGHEKGYSVVAGLIERAFELGIKVFSFWAFSTENWNRTQEEVGYLMNMFNKFVLIEGKKLHEKNVKFVMSGSRLELPEDLQRAILEIEQLTKDNTAGTVNLCLNYGGRREILDAVKKLVANGQEVAADSIDKSLYQDLPNLDLIIRTSGEQRLSGFQLWRGEYAELLFLDKHFPEMTPDDITAAVEIFSKRQRRFGE